MLSQLQRKNFVFLWAGIMCFFFIPQSQVYAALPDYFIELDPEHLSLLNQTPVVKDVLYVEAATGDSYYPALFISDGDTTACEVRHRASWSMFYPRRSWRLKFDDKDILGGERININSEYKDYSAMRNLLTNELFTFFGWPAPETKHVNYYVNGEYMGVFSHIENVDEDFLERHGKTIGTMYKLGDHGGAMVPLTRQQRYDRTWAKKIGDPLDYSDIQMLFNKILYWTKEDFDAGISSLVDIDNVLMYFAIMYAVVGGDSCTKNYYLYHNPDSGLWEILPWDTDDSFRGENADTGLTLYNHVLFQRLMENEGWRAEYQEKLDRVINEGFEYLEMLVEETHRLISVDIYRDNKREAGNSQFESDVQYIKSFMVKRREFITSRAPFDKNRLYDYSCSNPFPDRINNEVTFTVRSDRPQKILVQYTDDLSFNSFGSSHTVKKLMMFDDGFHEDGEAGDLLYGNTLTISDSFKGVIPYCYQASYKYEYPQNGLFYVQWVRYNTLALNTKNFKSDYIESIEIGDVYHYADDVFIELKNTSNTRVDISYCHIRGNEYFEDFLIPAYTTISGGKSIFITSNTSLAKQAFDGLSWVENRPLGSLSYSVSEGDSIKLISPTLSFLKGTVCEALKELVIERYPVVINEINYNSADDHDSGDWVELYNPNETEVDLGGWVFKDDEEHHAFIFPEGTRLRENAYLVVSRNKKELQRHYWWSIPSLGDFDFGLSGSGGKVQLFDNSGVLVDYVKYNDKEPWPLEPDGEGATLSLINPVLDNEKAESWAASSGNGTPGKKNDVYTVGVDDTAPVAFSLKQNFPNPFNPITTIPFTLSTDSHVRLAVYSVLGQHVKTLVDERVSAGKHQIAFDADGLSSGIYIYRLEAGDFHKNASMLLVK